jgi:glycosyltransferase involved in cell wall biosynthesis
MLRFAVDAANFVLDHRGMGRFVRSVIRAARADPQIALEFISLRHRDDAPLRAEFAGVPLHRPARANRRDVYDAVWYPWNGIRFRCKAPALVTIHDAFAFEDPAREPIARWREQAPIRRAARFATKISTISQWSADGIVKALHIDPARLAVVPLAPDAFFSPGDDAPPAAVAGTRYILLVGPREARKNARTLIAACARALRAPGEVLVVAGKLSPEDAKVAKALSVAVNELDADDDALRALYRNATAVAVPSRAEGFGLVAVEAQACGAPVLASNASALPEATGGVAIMLDPFDVDAWARAIRRLFDDPLAAAELRLRGVARFEHADRALPALRTLDLLREIAHAGP